MRSKRLWLAFGGLFFVLVSSGFFWQIMPLFNGAETTGKVVDTQKAGSGSNSRHMWKPVVAYVVDEQTYKLESKVAFRGSFKKGEQVTVSYSKSNPNKARVVGTIKEFLMILPFFLAGVGLLYIAIFKPSVIH
jgi:hypothetical protein